MTIFIDSFSGPVADLKKGKRTLRDILESLKANPRVSTFDMSEHQWLWKRIYRLERMGYVVQDKSIEYPWHVFNITEDGEKRLSDPLPFLYK
jgi:hypothetical protein